MRLHPGFIAAAVVGLTLATPSRAGDHGKAHFDKAKAVAKDKAKAKAKDKDKDHRGKDDDKRRGDDEEHGDRGHDGDHDAAADTGRGEGADKLAHENDKHERRMALIAKLDKIAADGMKADLAAKAKGLRDKEDTRHARVLARLNGDEHGKAGDEHGKAGDEHGKAGDEHGKAGDEHGKAGEHGKHKGGAK